MPATTSSTQSGARQDQRIVRMYRDQGYPASQIAAELAVTKTYVYSRLRARGVALRATQRDERRARQVTRLYLSGMTVAQIAARTGLDRSTVSRDIRQGGESIRDQRFRARRARALWDDGLTVAQIAHATGTRKPTVRRYLSSEGVTGDAIDTRAAEAHQREVLAAVAAYAAQAPGRPTAAGYDRYAKRTGAPGRPRHIGWRVLLSQTPLSAAADSRRQKIIDVIVAMGDGARSKDYKDAASADPDLPGFAALTALFGSWKGACRAAGVRPAGANHQGHTMRGSFTQAEKALRDLYAAEGRPLRLDDYLRLRRRRKLPSMASLYRRYGSWPQACQAAGVPSTYDQPQATHAAHAAADDPLVIPASLKRRLRALSAAQPDGRVTAVIYHNARMADPDGLPSLSALYRHHGRLGAILLALGLPCEHDQQTRLDDPHLHQSLRRAADLIGQPLTSRRYDRLRRERPDIGLVSSSVIRKWLGSWANALQAAGVTAPGHPGICGGTPAAMLGPRTLRSRAATRHLAPEHALPTPASVDVAPAA